MEQKIWTRMNVHAKHFIYGARERDRERSHDHHVDGGNMNNINRKQRESHVREGWTWNQMEISYY